MHFFPALVFLFLLFSTFSPCTRAAFSPAIDELESGYNTIVDENDQIILQSGLVLHVGDRYISEDNNLYEITIIEGSLAKARYIESEPTLSLETELITVQGAANGSQPIIAIYHTHTDESYIPTDGNSTTPGEGSIMKVGDRFSSRLKELGYQPLHNKTLHEPHDANAYQRSRRTFMKLLERQPAALFDLHRDSGPLAFYKTTINGQDAAKILLVVGRQNQNQATTLQYAKRIKANADKMYKGLIRGIFMARGNYNQDLNPRSMLLEMGTQYNTREAAEHSAALFADILPSIITPKPLPASPAPKAADTTIPGTTSSNDTGNGGNTITETSAGNVANIQDAGITVSNILSIIGAVLLGIIAYLYLSTGNWQEAKNKLHKFYKYEFTNFLGPRKKRKD
ncbi:stage II sporulation protein P [Pelosinus fermentans]|uniref:Stage II sporulation protein P n=1 Tax=Pelosinus fermentans JBW45 TaxID=1192197 RepID=I9DFV2_9FIRM|nr:stage II sporulation protein P [Pelosinus fermentans]AJQ29254.1 stage II sporulation protein P [Pelosinus fermentans JBW45]